MLSRFALALALGLSAVATMPRQTDAATPHRDIVDTALADGRFATLAAALEAAGLVDALRGDGPFTVFAPTDDAFAKLPDETREFLLSPAGKDRLTAILTYHVLAARVSAVDALRAGEAATLGGPKVSARLESGRLRINGANVIVNDIECTNGIIHVIDDVLLPPEPKGRKVIGVYFEEPSAALRAQLRLPSHAGLLITRLVADGEARKAGLRKFDLVRTIDGRPATSQELRDAKERAGFGGRVRLGIVRGGEELHVEVGVGVES